MKENSEMIKLSQNYPFPVSTWSHFRNIIPYKNLQRIFSVTGLFLFLSPFSDKLAKQSISAIIQRIGTCTEKNRLIIF